MTIPERVVSTGHVLRDGEYSRLPTPALATNDAKRRMLLRSLWLGICIWPIFTLLDAWMCFVAYPGAQFGTFVLIRIVVELLMILTWVAGRHVHIGVDSLSRLTTTCYAAAAVAIAVMAISLGGVRSSYMHGISLIALVRAVTIHEPWREAWLKYVIIALAFPAVMAISVAIQPQTRSDIFGVDALIAFGSNYVFVLSSAIMGMLASSTMWHAQQQLYRARRVGRYRLLAPIGKGGMGEVWLAWDSSLQRNIALKLLRVGDSAHPEMVARFEREALAASRLRSPHVIQIFDFGASDDGLLYIVMEYLQGVNLQDLVEREGKLAPAQAIDFTIQACLALEEAHRNGFIHRDIKPHNLFVTTVDEGPQLLKLLDFGIVRFREPGGDLTMTGMMVGTPLYLAPEIWAGAAADERSDLYALGATLYFMLAGRVPFEASPRARLQHPASLCDGAENESLRELDEIVARTLAFDPEARFHSAAELRTSLEGLRTRAEF